MYICKSEYNGGDAPFSNWLHHTTSRSNAMQAASPLNKINNIKKGRRPNSVEKKVSLKLKAKLRMHIRKFGLHPSGGFNPLPPLLISVWSKSWQTNFFNSTFSTTEPPFSGAIISSAQLFANL